MHTPKLVVTLEIAALNSSMADDIMPYLSNVVMSSGPVQYLEDARAAVTAYIAPQSLLHLQLLRTRLTIGEWRRQGGGSAGGREEG